MGRFVSRSGVCGHGPLRRGHTHLLIWGSALLAALLGTAPAVAEVSVISWKPYSELSVRSSADEEATARLECVRWAIAQHLLAPDVLRIWQAEVDAAISQSPGDYVKSIAARQDGYYVTLDVAQINRTLVSVIFGTITPRVAVCTSEVVLRRPVPDPAVQTAVSSMLLDYGFQVVDLEAYREALQRERNFQAADGDVEAFRNLANEVQADIVVVGESFAEQHRDHGGFSARVEFKFREGATGRVLGSFAETHEVRDANSELVAAKAALQRAAETSPMRVVKQLLNAYGRPVSSVRVLKTRSVSEVGRVKKALETHVPGCKVKIVEMHVKGAQACLLSLDTKEDAAEVAVVLESIENLPIRVTTLQCRNIICELQ